MSICGFLVHFARHSKGVLRVKLLRLPGEGHGWQRIVTADFQD